MENAILWPKETQEHARQFAQSQQCKRMLSNSNGVAFSFGYVAGYTFLEFLFSIIHHQYFCELQEQFMTLIDKVKLLSSLVKLNVRGLNRKLELSGF